MEDIEKSFKKHKIVEEEKDGNDYNNRNNTNNIPN